MCIETLRAKEKEIREIRESSFNGMQYAVHELVNLLFESKTTMFLFLFFILVELICYSSIPAYNEISLISWLTFDCILNMKHWKHKMFIFVITHLCRFAICLRRELSVQQKAPRALLNLFESWRFFWNVIENQMRKIIQFRIRLVCNVSLVVATLICQAAARSTERFFFSKKKNE